MLTRICLIVAILAGLGVAGLNFAKIKPRIAELTTNLDATTKDRDEKNNQLVATTKKLQTTEKERDEAKGEIASAQEERDKAVTDAENQKKRADKLTDDLAKSRGETSDAQTLLARWDALGMTPEQLRTLQKDSKQMQADLAAATESSKRFAQQAKTLQNKLDGILGGGERVVPLPPDLEGKVLVADPKWDFVVLNVGEKQGALEDGVLLVNRNGKLVAKVKIRSVLADRCIANVLPNWKLGEVMEGDQVIP